MTNYCVLHYNFVIDQNHKFKASVKLVMDVFFKMN
jgi:hypothetical protein